MNPVTRDLASLCLIFLGTYLANRVNDRRILKLIGDKLREFKCPRAPFRSTDLID